MIVLKKKFGEVKHLLQKFLGAGEVAERSVSAERAPYIFFTRRTPRRERKVQVNEAPGRIIACFDASRSAAQ